MVDEFEEEFSDEEAPFDPEADEIDKAQEAPRRLLPKQQQQQQIKEEVRGRGRPPKAQSPVPVQTQRQQSSKRYSAYAFPERRGIKDDSTNQSIGEDIYDLLAKIMNDIQDIKEAVL